MTIIQRNTDLLLSVQDSADFTGSAAFPGRMLLQPSQNAIMPTMM
jgi:hypothetical protein